MSVGTLISSLHERHSLTSGEQLEPEQRKNFNRLPWFWFPAVLELSACDLDVKTDAL